MSDQANICSNCLSEALQRQIAGMSLAQLEAFYIEILHEQESMEPESEMRKLCDALLVYIKQQQQLQSIEILTAKMEKVFEE